MKTFPSRNTRREAARTRREPALPQFSYGALWWSCSLVCAPLQSITARSGLCGKQQARKNRLLSSLDYNHDLSVLLFCIKLNFMITLIAIFMRFSRYYTLAFCSHARYMQIATKTFFFLQRRRIVVSIGLNRISMTQVRVDFSSQLSSIPLKLTFRGSM